MSNKKILVLPGDGIGSEVMTEVLNLVDWMTKYKSFSFDYSFRTYDTEKTYIASYLSLGIIQEAKKTTSVLAYNYKKSNWYKLSYELLKKYGYKKNGKKS